jgi:hypothetical protein
VTNTKKTEATKAPTQRTDAAGNTSDQPVTKLAEVNDPAKLTEAKIAEISGDDGTNDRENSANQDVADHLRDTKAEAKSAKFGDPDVVLSRNGGAQGEPG